MRVDLKGRSFGRMGVWAVVGQIFFMSMCKLMCPNLKADEERVLIRLSSTHIRLLVNKKIVELSCVGLDFDLHGRSEFYKKPLSLGWYVWCNDFGQ